MARPFEEQSAAIDIKPPALVKTEGPAQPHLFTVSVQGKKKKNLPYCQPVTNAALVSPVFLAM